MDLSQFANMLKSGGNPKNMVLQMLKSQSGNNPVMSNVFNMVKNGDEKGLETLARNLAKEKGIDVDNAVSKIRGQLGL